MSFSEAMVHSGSSLPCWRSWVSRCPLVQTCRVRFFLSALSVVAIFLLPAAQADIVYSGEQNIIIPEFTGGDSIDPGIYLDIDGGTGSPAGFITRTTEFSGWDVNFFFGGLGIAASPDFQPAREDTSNESTVLLLTLNDPIGTNLPYSTGYTGSDRHVGGPDHFQNGVPGYLGFRFITNDHGGIYYGWMRVTLTANTSGAIIHDWAWDTTGGPVLAGATKVPEPPSVAALSALLLRLLLLPGRRRHSACFRPAVH